MDAVYRSDAQPRRAAGARRASSRRSRSGRSRSGRRSCSRRWPGVTNYPFRALCRALRRRPLRERDDHRARRWSRATARRCSSPSFGPEETPRSLQLYGVDPHYVGEAVKRLVGEGRVDHIDMNFGCPVRKVTRKGGGAAIPLKPRLLARDRARGGAAARARCRSRSSSASGIDDDAPHLPRRRPRRRRKRAAPRSALHARTAAQLYDGAGALGRDRASSSSAVTRIPVLGNGDIWEADDALRMMRTTGCDGVIVGRGCLGRPWLFRDLADVFDGREPREPAAPRRGGRTSCCEHARAARGLARRGAGDARVPQAQRAGTRRASAAARQLRAAADARRARCASSTDVLGRARPRASRFRPTRMRVPRGKTGGTQKVALPGRLPRRPRRRRAPGTKPRPPTPAASGPSAVPHPAQDLREGRPLAVHQDADAVDPGRHPDHARDGSARSRSDRERDLPDRRREHADAQEHQERAS